MQRPRNMTTVSPTLSRPPAARLRRGTLRRRRGSAMILAVAAVLILLLVGLGYLSAAQLSRMGATGVTRSGNTDAAVNATVNLLGDMIADNTKAYTQASAPAEQAGYYATIPNTTYYPWLASTEPGDTDGTASTMATGQTDGDWLVWRQISRLPAPSTTNSFLPYVDPTDMSDDGTTQTDVDATRVGPPFWSDGALVDADGDGLLDSRWTRLPIAGADGMTWIAAVRIVDESGRVNINTATEAEWMVAGSDVVGATPADIDVKRLLAETDFRSGAPAEGMPNWDAMDAMQGSFVSPTLSPPTLVGYTSSNSTDGVMANVYHALYGGAGSGPVTTNNYASLLPFTSNFRMTLWTSAGNNLTFVSTNTPFQRFGNDTWTDLRRRGGLPAAGWAGLEANLDGKAIAPTGTPTTGVGPLMAALEMTGNDITAGRNNYLTTNRIKASVRGQLTTYNVSRPYRPRWLSGATGMLGTNDVKLNPNFPLPTMLSTNTPELNAVYAAMVEVFEAPETTNYYGGGTQPEARRYAAAMLANLMTYRTTNSRYDPEPYYMQDADDRVYFGQQLQPYFTEGVAMIVYADQLDPETTNGTLIDRPDPAAANTEWTGQYVMAELANPFPESLELTNTNGGFYLVVNTNGSASQTPYPLWDTTNNVTKLTSNGRLLVYSRDTTHTTNDASLQSTAATMTADARIGIDGLRWSPGSPDISFELYYSNGTNMLLVDRLRYSTTNVHGATINWPPMPIVSTNTDVGTDGHRLVVSASIQRDDRDIPGSFPHYIYENPEFNFGIATSNIGAPTSNLNPANAIGADNGNNLDAALGTTLPPMQLFHKRGDLDTLGELANVLTVANRTAPLASYPGSVGFGQWEATISEQLGSAQAIPYRDKGRLIFTAYVRRDPPHVPIAATMFDQFTLLEGSDATRDTATPKVYGLVNPSTATRRTLEVMPYMRGGGLLESYKSPALNEPDIARGLLAYRDLYNLQIDAAISSPANPLNFVDREAVRDPGNINSLLTDLRTEPGFASIGELMMVRREQLGITPNDNDRQFTMVRQVHDPFDAGIIDGDLASPADGIENDYEEELLHFNRISNLLTLNSDVFVAYVVLQGRRIDPISGLYEKAVERRFIVGYDRSDVIGDPSETETARVLFFVEDR